MAKPQHTRISWVGTFGTNTSPYEQWVFSLNMSPGLPAPGDAEALAALAESAVQPLLDHSRVNARLREVKVAEIGADGLYTGDPVIVTSTRQGVGSSGSLAPQLALAVTLDTDRRGATGRGRFYLPMPNAQPDAQGLIPATDAQAVADAAAGLCTALNGAQGYGTVGVVSTKGYISPVTTVRVGRVLDTIRSRRAQVAEQYGTDVVVTGQS